MCASTLTTSEALLKPMSSHHIGSSNYKNDPGVVAHKRLHPVARIEQTSMLAWLERPRIGMN